MFVVEITVPAVSHAQNDENLLSQEYFLQQAADEDLLITISAFEAEFESRVTGENGEVLLESAVPGSRIIPLFQYVDSPDSLRQLDIKVSSNLHTARSDFSLSYCSMLPDISTTMTKDFAWVERPRIENSTPGVSALGSGSGVIVSTGSVTFTGMAASWLLTSISCFLSRDICCSRPSLAWVS